MTGRVDRIVDVIRHHIDIGAQRGAQIYVSRHGTPLLDVGVGTTDAGIPVTPQHVLPWMGCTRVLVSLAVARLLERDRLGLDDIVGTHVPAAGARANCSIRHLLTHLAGFPDLDTSTAPGTDAELAAAAFSFSGAHPTGMRAHYHRSGAWRVLGEVVAAVSGQDIATHIRQELWEPLGMDATYLALDGDDLERLGDWLVLPERATPQARGWSSAATAVDVGAHTDPRILGRVDPDLGGYGPAHDLARPFEALVTGKPVPLRDQLLVELVTAPHRIGLRDGAFGGARIPWGFGMMVAGAFAGTVGHRSFGHDALPGGRVLCDPDEGLVMVFLTSGFIGPDEDARRLAEVTEAVYDAAAPRPRSAAVSTEPGVVALRHPI